MNEPDDDRNDTRGWVIIAVIVVALLGVWLYADSCSGDYTREDAIEDHAERELNG